MQRPKKVSRNINPRASGPQFKKNFGSKILKHIKLEIISVLAILVDNVD